MSASFVFAGLTYLLKNKTYKWKNIGMCVVYVRLFNATDYSYNINAVGSS